MLKRNLIDFEIENFRFLIKVFNLNIRGKLRNPSFGSILIRFEKRSLIDFELENVSIIKLRF